MQSVTSRLETSLYQNFSYYFESFDGENFGLGKSLSLGLKKMSPSQAWSWPPVCSRTRDYVAQSTIVCKILLTHSRIYLAHHYWEVKMIVTPGLTEWVFKLWLTQWLFTLFIQVRVNEEHVIKWNLTYSMNTFLSDPSPIIVYPCH